MKGITIWSFSTRTAKKMADSEKREHPWMATEAEQREITATLWAAEAMARDRESNMAVGRDLKVKPIHAELTDERKEVLRNLYDVVEIVTY